MNDLDDLRDAMRTTPDFEPRPLDLAVVMAAGGRLRRRRRFAVGAASGLAVLALLVGGAQFVLPQMAPQQTAAPAETATATDPVPATGDASSRAVLGEVVTTGLRDDLGERVLWVVPLEPTAAFGIVSGWRLADGSLRPDVLANESAGSARAEGFHAAQAPMAVEDRITMAFGYYAGPATRITVRVAGRPIDAQQATWSEDPSIVLFWFPPDLVRPGAKPSGLTAYDRDGGRLPAGNTTFAVG